MADILKNKPLVIAAAIAALVILTIVVFRTMPSATSSEAYSAQLSKEVPTPQPNAKVFPHDPNDTPTISRDQIRMLQKQGK